MEGKPFGKSGVGNLLHFKNVINELKSLSFKSEKIIKIIVRNRYGARNEHQLVSK